MNSAFPWQSVSPNEAKCLKITEVRPDRGRNIAIRPAGILSALDKGWDAAIAELWFRKFRALKAVFPGKQKHD